MRQRSDRIREIDEGSEVISTQWGIPGKPLAGVVDTPAALKFIRPA